MKYSWNAKTPMTSPDMVAKPIKWNPMDACRYPVS